MKILCVGGGSGGHVTPVVAIANAVSRLRPDANIHLVTDKRFLSQARQLVGDSNISISTVAAGKLRRYANLKWYQHFQHLFVSYIPNVLDMFKIIIGIVQSNIKIIKFRPDVIFIKGGYVGLPVGLAAAILWPRVPIVLHDSDASPGLTNRVLSRYAVQIATAMPTEFYPYDAAKTKYVGMPIRDGIKPASARVKKELKTELKFNPDAPLVLAMGGGQGSRSINRAVLAGYPQIKGHAEVILMAGEKNLTEVKEVISQKPRDFIKLHTAGFVGGQRGIDIERAADVAIIRAGATTLAEMAALGMPTIIIPSPYLAADHQTKNAEVFVKSDAAIVITEDELNSSEILAQAVVGLLGDKKQQRELSENIKKFDRADAAGEMAKIIIEVGDGGSTQKK